MHKPVYTFVALLTALTTLTALTACSATGGAPRTDPNAAGGGTVDTPRMTVAMISHGAPGDTFWDLVRKGAEDAARKDNVELRYSADPQAPNQSNLVDSAVDAAVDGIAVTLPNLDAIGPAARRAVDKKIPVVGLNAGMSRYQDYGLSAFFGQDEALSGQRAGERLAKDNGGNPGKVLCVIHEQGNSSQEDRCAGLRKGLGGAGQVDILYVNGMDLTATQATIQAKLSQDKQVRWLMGLVAPVALRAADAKDAAGRGDVHIATFDTNAELVAAIKKDRIAFAVDQQPYLQGYLAVDALWLAKRNGTTVGGGQPVLTGPSFVDKSNVDLIADAAKAGLR
ncbi:substrate-binding domain-containing protein [Corynebacterium uberis]|uniref:substrate-binding domain-containing protein n=1 Tax=Corynebacterium uberis TaxID=2883169 RepID=UPI003D162030